MIRLVKIKNKNIKKFRASAYSCLASAIVRTQTNPDFARVFFFASKPKDNQYPWERVVDTETPIEFKVETDFPKKSWNSLIAADNIVKQKKYILFNYLFIYGF